jgi:periplasmic divalent cation tolerance protein
MILVLTTYPDGADALKFAELAIKEKLAGCIQISSPITSVYSWQGELKHDSEVQVLIKTTESQLQTLEKRLHETHPYSLPQFIAITGSASKKYEDWLQS